jgi:hypothetical protein
MVDCFFCANARRGDVKDVCIAKERRERMNVL